MVDRPEEENIMKHVPRITVLLVALTTIIACGDAAPDPTNTGVSASLSAFAVFDASGIWKVVSNDCKGFPLPGQFENSVKNTSSDIQTFQTQSFQALLDDQAVIVLPSEGTLDAQTGAYKLCYSSELSDCQVSCTGTVNAENHVDLNCNKPNGDLICKMALKKQEG